MKQVLIVALWCSLAFGQKPPVGFSKVISITVQQGGSLKGSFVYPFTLNFADCTVSISGSVVSISSCGSSGGIPSGLITLVASGTCPSGFSEVSALNGKFLQGTIAANGDVGQTGGNSTITPAGTVSQPTLAMNSYTPGGTNTTASFTPSGTNAWPVGVPAFAGNSGTVPAETFTGSAGTVPAETISYPANVPTFSGNSGTVPAETFTGSSGTVPAETFTGNSGTVPAETISWPVGVPTISGVPGLGTLANVATNTSGNCAATNIAAGTGSTTACKATAPNLTVPAEGHTGALTAGTLANAWPAGVPTNGTVSFTPSGSNGTVSFTPAGTNGTVNFTPSGTVAWPANPPTNGTVSFTPAGTNGTVSFTPTGSITWPVGVPAFSGSSGTVPAEVFSGTPATLTGTVSQPTFSGTPVDPRPQFTKVIFCSKN